MKSKKYIIVPTNQFKRDFKLARKRRRDIEKIMVVIDTLAAGNKLSDKEKDHKLIGKYSDFRECHIEPDWLLINKITKEELILVRTGSHTDLFE